ncbi:MAG: hypothetical protein COA67_09275 [Lutibacter sp.]|nr:MAG: hypothetical protein COA67_09275 [Lutibacter sp.]
MKVNKFSFVCAILCLVSINIIAQNLKRSTVGVSGSSIELTVNDNNFYISQSVGQNSVIGTFVKDSYGIRQGFQQPPIKIEVITDVINDLNVVAYPNPVRNHITILFNDVLKTSFEVTLFDITGKLISNKNYGPSRSKQVNMSSLSTGIYFLNVTSENKKFSVRLIKE